MAFSKSVCFRTGHSMTNALNKIANDIRVGMENEQVTVLTLLDFSKAFDGVDCDQLLELLYFLNIPTSVICWF